MELNDGAFPLLAGVTQSDDPNAAFAGANIAMLVGSRPRSKGMERKDLLEANGAIFTVQGKALNDNAADDIKILVVGNPANTNSLIAMNNAADIPDARFTAMTRLDHNRAQAQLAQKLGVTVNDIAKMTIWGNHSATQYPDLFHCEVNGANAAETVGIRTGSRTRSFPPSSSAVPRSSRPAVCPPQRRRRRLPSTTSTTGCSALRPATGFRWRSRPTAATACPRA